MQDQNSSNDNSRRDFLKLTSLAAFAFHPTISALANFLNTDKKDIEEWLTDEFHYFDNNLTNLHFYFINAKFLGKLLVQIHPKDDAYMIVKIPQQHISEELLTESEFDSDYSNSLKNTKSKISGFSYLAFKIQKKRIDISSIETLINWDNDNFSLLIPEEKDYKLFNDEIKNFNDFKRVKPWLREEKNNETIFEFYKNICKDLFKKDDTNFPVTILEIPQGLLTTPYVAKEPIKIKGNEIKTKVTFSPPPTKKQQFIYSTAKGKIVRSVQEIWNSQMWFQQFYEDEETKAEILYGDKQSPSLRPIAYFEDNDVKREVCCDKNGVPILDGNNKEIINECPKEDVTFLPTFLDKQEITYIASLGRKSDNKGKEWNIETKGLTFTGLGAIAKFHYKNFTPPNGTDLAEYEHHITLGRDEYIKVARIGIISVTGQKALHVKIGQRKIKDGTSYMEIKQYIEIIQKEINYFDETLFIKDDPNKKEPYNYIQARKNITTNDTNKIIHSYDDIYDGLENPDPNNDVWFDRTLWGIPGTSKYLPENWNTHYRRWPFKKVLSITLVSKPICTPENILGKADECKCLEAFWPILELKNEKEKWECFKDCELDFIGLDWNNKEIKFSSTFLFIRKTVIEASNEATIKRIYENFIGQKDATRRQIRFINSEIAFTEDFIPNYQSEGGKDELQNKSNIAKTDYLEYYFGICKELVGNTLVYNGKKIIPSTESYKTESIFNERLFPLFPQVKRAQLYIENIQSYAQEPLASIIEYNDDYINYGYEGKVRNKDGTAKIFSQKGASVEPIYNKARLIFNHTDNFIKNNDNILEFKNGKWAPEEVESGYKKIKQAFSGAGNAIGGLVNPDFDIQSIGLVKQSIAVGKDINKKYEQVAEFTDKIEKFNPSDLLRQAPEIFNGISLIDILQEVFPEYEAPINDIKNVASKIDTIKNEFLDNPIYLEIKSELEFVNNQVTNYLKTIDEFQKEIDKTQEEIKGLKDKFNREFLVSEIEKLVSSTVSKYKISFLDEVNSVANIANTTKNEILTYLATELISKAEAIYPYYQILKDSKDIFYKIKKEDVPSLTVIIDSYINEFIQNTQYLLIDISKNKDKNEEILIDYNTVKSGISNLISLPYANYLAYSNAVNEEIKAFSDYQNSLPKDIETNYKEYLSKKTISLKAINDYNKIANDLKEKKKKILKLIDELRADKYKDEYQKIKHFEQDILKIQNSIAYLNDIIDTVNIPHFTDTFNKAINDVKAFESKLNGSLLPLVKSVIYDKKFIDNITNNRKTLEAHYNSNYDLYKKDFRKLITESEKTIAQYVNSVGKESIEAVLNHIDLPQDFIKLKNAILAQEKELKDKVQEQLKEIKKYESFLKKQIDSRGKEIIDLIKDKIEEKEKELLNNPENQNLINAFIKGKELLNILSSLSKKETNYNWQTSSFKNADFGIVSFLASNNPKTSLSVNVKNTVYFQPNKFPAVIQKIEAYAENRLNNFSISLLKSIIINFNEVRFIAGTNQKPKFEVKIRDVQFAGAFSFVQALESIFKDLLGDNFSVKIQPLSVEIQYLLPIAYIGVPSFGFKDILFKISYTLHFDKKPMELGVGIGTPENRTKLSVGVYTGLFYFIVIGNPKQGITTIEVSIEFGGYYGINLGPLRGEVKLVVGLYYRKDLSGVIMEGYFLCEGRVKLWFMMITARFYMGVRSQGGYVEGRCTVTYEIRISRFFKRSFSATYYKKIAGASPENNQSGSTQKSINQYIKDTNKNYRELSPEKYLEQYNIIKPKITNPVERIVEPLTLTQWEIFINSYYNPENK